MVKTGQDASTLQMSGNYKLDLDEYSEYAIRVFRECGKDYEQAILNLRDTNKMVVSAFMFQCYLDAKVPSDVAMQLKAKVPMVPARQPDFEFAPSSPPKVMVSIGKKEHWWSRFLR